MNHQKLIDKLENEFHINFSQFHKEFIDNMEAKAMIPSKMAGEILSVVNCYKLYGGINHTWKAYNAIINAIGEYREDEYYTQNGMIRNNTVREEIKTLLDSLRFCKSKLNKICNESENPEPQIGSIISLIESFQVVLEDKKTDFPYIPKTK